MPPLSTADLANANANDAARNAEDAHALIVWLIERVEALEQATGNITPCRPELPSERKQRVYYEINERERAQQATSFRERYGYDMPVTGGA